MEELIKLVTQKVGISEDMAKKAVETVLGFLKDKLPGGLGNQIDGFLSGGGSNEVLGNATKGLGDMLGKS